MPALIRHIVLFRWKDDIALAQVHELCAVLESLPESVPEIQTYRFGPDVIGADGNYDFAIVADFVDADAYDRYRTHPVHQQIIASRIRPMMAERAAVQVEFQRADLPASVRPPWHGLAG